jgi:quercetin dioxygenase-like cupin family protein
MGSHGDRIAEGADSRTQILGNEKQNIGARVLRGGGCGDARYQDRETRYREREPGCNTACAKSPHSAMMQQRPAARPPIPGGDCRTMEGVMAEANPGDRTLGDVATKLLFENDTVKVWEMSLESGESSDLHRHEFEYFFVVLEGESIDADFTGGKSIRIPVEQGKVIYVPPGNTEIAVNRSDVRYREILVELKDRPRARSTGR